MGDDIVVRSLNNYSGRRRRVKVSVLRLFFVIFVFVGVTVKYASLITS